MTAGSDADSHSAHSGRERALISAAEEPRQGPDTVRGAVTIYCLNAIQYALWSGDRVRSLQQDRTTDMPLLSELQLSHADP